MPTIKHERRLERHTRKELKKRAIFFGGLLVVLLVFSLTIGLQFVISGSSLLSNLLGKRDDSDRKSAPLQNLVINDIPEATNSAQILVTGSANNYEDVEFYVNDKRVNIINDPEGSFSEEVGGLEPGENEIYIIGKSKRDEKRSNSYTVIYRAEKPKLEITEPGDNSTTDKEEITVAGKTDKDINIRVNDLPVVTDANGGFRTSVRLTEGENKIKITAIDPAGNTEEKTLTVKREKP